MPGDHDAAEPRPPEPGPSSEQPPGPLPRPAPALSVSLHCLDCGYRLVERAGQCPECGRGYDLSVPGTYGVVPPALRWRMWLPAVAFTTIAAIVGMLTIVGLNGSWGVAAVITLPL